MARRQHWKEGNEGPLAFSECTTVNVRYPSIPQQWPLRRHPHHRLLFFCPCVCRGRLCGCCFPCSALNLNNLQIQRLMNLSRRVARQSATRIAQTTCSERKRLPQGELFRSGDGGHSQPGKGGDTAEGAGWGRPCRPPRRSSSCSCGTNPAGPPAVPPPQWTAPHPLSVVVAAQAIPPTATGTAVNPAHGGFPFFVIASQPSRLPSGTPDPNLQPRSCLPQYLWSPHPGCPF